MKNILRLLVSVLIGLFSFPILGQDFKTLRLGKESVSYSGEIYPSVGNNFRIECDTTAFKIDKQVKYYNPEAVSQGMPGGDEASVIYTLYPKRTGIFIIHEVSDFRGEETKRVKHIVIVK